jgi:hypothetical protein
MATIGSLFPIDTTSVSGVAITSTEAGFLGNANATAGNVNASSVVTVDASGDINSGLTNVTLTGILTVDGITIQEHSGGVQYLQVGGGTAATTRLYVGTDKYIAADGSNNLTSSGSTQVLTADLSGDGILYAADSFADIDTKVLSAAAVDNRIDTRLTNINNSSISTGTLSVSDTLTLNQSTLTGSGYTNDLTISAGANELATASAIKTYVDEGVSGTVGPTTLSPLGTYNVDGIPSNATEVHVILDDVSVSNGDYIIMSTRDTGGDYISGWDSLGAFDREGVSAVLWPSSGVRLTQNTIASDKWSMVITLQKYTTNQWSIFSSYVFKIDNTTPTALGQRVISGKTPAMSNPLYGFKFSTSGSGTFDGGNVTLRWKV